MKKSLEEFFVLNDKDSVKCSTLWCTHKAYARGLHIQIAAREEKSKTSKRNTFLKDLSKLEEIHKKNLKLQT